MSVLTLGSLHKEGIKSNKINFYTLANALNIIGVSADLFKDGRYVYNISNHYKFVLL